VPTPRPKPGDSAALPSEFIEDLAQLPSGGLAVYLCLEGKGAAFSMKCKEALAFGEAIMDRWRSLTPPERVVKGAHWIRDAARYNRKPWIWWSPPMQDKLASSLRGA
jgi:hypothetical protein